MTRYSLIVPVGAPLWAENLQLQFDEALNRIRGDMKRKRLTVAELPRDGSERLAIVTDEAGGEALAFFTTDKQWRRTTGRALVT